MDLIILNMFLTLWETADLFFRWLHSFAGFPGASSQLTSARKLLLLCILVITSVLPVCLCLFWYTLWHLVVLICISPVTNDVAIPSVMFVDGQLVSLHFSWFSPFMINWVNSIFFSIFFIVLVAITSEYLALFHLWL